MVSSCELCVGQAGVRQCRRNVCRWYPYCHSHSPVELKKTATFGWGVYAKSDIPKGVKLADFKKARRVPIGTTGRHIWQKNKSTAYDGANSLAGLFNRQSKDNPPTGRINGNGSVVTTKAVAKGQQIFVTGYGPGHKF